MLSFRKARRPAAAILWISVVLLAESRCADNPAQLPVPTADQPCPPWVLFPADRYSNADSPYLGCTLAVNLRANIGNPADLARGRPLRPADGQRETLAVETYQQGKIKPFGGGGTTGSVTTTTTSSPGGQ